MSSHLSSVLSLFIPCNRNGTVTVRKGRRARYQVSQPIKHPRACTVSGFVSQHRGEPTLLVFFLCNSFGLLYLIYLTTSVHSSLVSTSLNTFLLHLNKEGRILFTSSVTHSKHQPHLLHVLSPYTEAVAIPIIIVIFQY